MPRGQLRSLVVYVHAVDRTDNGAPENPKLYLFNRNITNLFRSLFIRNKSLLMGYLNTNTARVYNLHQTDYV